MSFQTQLKNQKNQSLCLLVAHHQELDREWRKWFIDLQPEGPLNTEKGGF